jgi:hypothetical protein
MSSFSSYNLVQLLKSLTYTIFTLQKYGKFCLKHWSGPISHMKKWESFCGTNNFDGTSWKENIRDSWSTDPTITTLIFLHTVSENPIESIWKAWGILVTIASTHGIQGGYSEYGPCVNILYRDLGQFTAQNKNCHCPHATMITWWGSPEI